jgi:WbqC-like protein family
MKKRVVVIVWLKLAPVMETRNPQPALPVLYLPPLGWFAAAVAVPSVHLTHHLPVWKGSLQARCYLKVPENLGCTQRLTVPMQHDDKARGFAHLRVSHTRPWQREHLRGVENYYRQAAYFEFYWPFLKAILAQEHVYMHELNSALLERVWAFLGLDSARLIWPATPDADHGLRVPAWSLAANGAPPQLHYTPYYQLYGPFQPNMTILDLLFHEGPWSVEVLQATALPTAQTLFSL